MEFPQYRKYKNVDTWFKITSSHHFIEINKVGKQYAYHSIKVVQYPEKLYIEDMLNCRDGRWEIIQATDFDKVALLS